MLMNKIAIKKIERFKFFVGKKHNPSFSTFSTAKRDWHSNFFWSLNSFFLFSSKKLLIYHIEEYLVREIKTRTPAIPLVSVVMKLSPVCTSFFSGVVVFFFHSLSPLWLSTIYRYVFAGWVKYSFRFSLFCCCCFVVLALLGLSIY